MEKEKGGGEERRRRRHMSVYVHTVRATHSLTQTSHARVTERRGSARRGAVSTRCTRGGTKREMLRKLTLHKHDSNMLAYQCNFWR